jgi:hypothetical protein
MNEINEQLKGISELITRIDAKVLEINTKLDELIKALHEYDDDNIYKGYDEPNVALLKAAGLYNEELNKAYGESSFEAFKDTQGESCVGNEHNIDVEEEMRKYTEQEMEKEAERRMNIIGQNGNTGEHYDEDSDKWSNKWELGGEG